jgi:electron transfer flavoprotein alpha subunit
MAEPPPPRRRRDPRAERESCRLSHPGRPRFTLAPSGMRRKRRDPRAERQALTIPAPRLRLDRSGRAAPSSAAALAPSALTPPTPARFPVQAPAPRVLADPAFFVWAVLEGDERRDAELLGAARLLAGQDAAAVALGDGASRPSALATLGACGADRVLSLPSTATPEAKSRLLATLIARLRPRHVLFAETEEGGDLARRVAALTGLDLFPDIEALSPREAVRPCPGGREEEAAPPAPLLTLRPERIPPHRGAPGEARVMPFPEDLGVDEPAAALSPARAYRLPPEEVPLEEAELVIAAGAGVRDIALFKALAKALGAQIGASRVVCDAGLLPRAAQVGASGRVIAPRAYLAFGISGAPQHLQGITEAAFVAAVNIDPTAPIMARADLAFPLDAEAVMRALLARLRPPSSVAAKER